MTAFGITPKSFKLLDELTANNNREWYHAHKEELREQLLDPFASILESASAKMKNAKRPFSGSKQTMFRLYRDTRFSNDKRPYKEHVGGLLTPSGNKKEDTALIYAHLASDGGFIASGFYRLETKDLNRIRDRMIEDAKTFQAITRKITKAGYHFAEIEPLKSMPRGYAQYADHEHATFLKMKSLIVSQNQSREAWIDGSVVKELVKLHKATVDLMLFGLEAIGKKS
ncbi:hypothetical protein C5Y96_24160 [Blastopirellula marina]|uniref:TIGR02453 family protein n=1 Tax=Blastopirellula marina TaxID=124 RepID=A0A2S8EZU0_9BACT|nr:MULTISPECIES: DUF2461 domain-containing protein [Pirellulaceae]PQO25439.1 hypothetical protein C5Y96_24160 [Blastopirellula marina]RCS42403.1 DUF2461 domain-containing protein [Bremerella cremea]